jgi:hypothetical protein
MKQVDWLHGLYCQVEGDAIFQPASNIINGKVSSQHESVMNHMPRAQFPGTNRLANINTDKDVTYRCRTILLCSGNGRPAVTCRPFI